MCTQLWKQLWRFCSNDLTQNAKTRLHYACSLNSLHSRQISVEKTGTHCALRVPQETLSQSWKTKFTLTWACHWLHFNSSRIQKIVCVFEMHRRKVYHHQSPRNEPRIPGLSYQFLDHWATAIRQPPALTIHTVQVYPRKGWVGARGVGWWFSYLVYWYRL